MNCNARIFVAGGETLVGAALIDRLRAVGYQHLVGTPPHEPDLTSPREMDDFFAEIHPEYVFLVAGQTGGIEANRQRPADLMLDNLLTATNVLDNAHRYGVEKLLYLASSCSYPRDAAQPMQVESLMTGPLEPTNVAYATAKLAGWQLCAAFRQQYGDPFITAIPANPFGPRDDFSPESGHVIPALLRRADEARRREDADLVIWGSGQPVREFLYAPDLADACLFVMEHYDEPEPINLGGGTELSIADTARLVAEVVGYRGWLRFDPSKPDGMPRKALDSSRLQKMGWSPATDFRTALAETYAWFLQHVVKEDPWYVRTAV